jgi:large subunit ribosomal protein L1
MPSERRGTVLEDVGGFIRRLQGSVEWKGDKGGTIRTAIGKVSFITFASQLIRLGC